MYREIETVAVCSLALGYHVIVLKLLVSILFKFVNFMHYIMDGVWPLKYVVEALKLCLEIAVLTTNQGLNNVLRKMTIYVSQGVLTKALCKQNHLWNSCGIPFRFRNEGA